ncbi:hypothetical protein RA11412_1429 [Rothia aeria]|uniref:Uncharacterized protein n=1 Tax=Rothia aeria TaxID=172042 RepID=A0A2Z5QZ57_9MICC|nr:hypothetical protein RA11412_1429 [Rothia aeria]
MDNLIYFDDVLNIRIHNSAFLSTYLVNNLGMFEAATQRLDGATERVY